jgi:hypothetical protein
MLYGLLFGCKLGRSIIFGLGIQNFKSQVFRWLKGVKKWLLTTESRGFRWLRSGNKRPVNHRKRFYAQRKNLCFRTSQMSSEHDHHF